MNGGSKKILQGTAIGLAAVCLVAGVGWYVWPAPERTRTFTVLNNTGAVVTNTVVTVDGVRTSLGDAAPDISRSAILTFDHHPREVIVDWVAGGMAIRARRPLAIIPEGFHGDFVLELTKAGLAFRFEEGFRPAGSEP